MLIFNCGGKPALKTTLNFAQNNYRGYKVFKQNFCVNFFATQISIAFTILLCCKTMLFITYYKSLGNFSQGTTKNE